MENKKTKKYKKGALFIGLFFMTVLFLSSVSAEFWACFGKGDIVDYCNPLISDRKVNKDKAMYCMESYNEENECYKAASWLDCYDVDQSECQYLGGSSGIDTEPPELLVHSPVQDEVYSSNRILLNMSFDEPANLYHMDNRDSRRGWRKICSGCVDNYERTLRFNEGRNNISFLAKDKKGNEGIVTKQFIVDSKKPRITSTEPRRGFASGDFVVEFREGSPKELSLHYGVEGDYKNDSVYIESSCVEGRRDTRCETYVDISGYSGQEIEYWFTLSDLSGRKDVSRKNQLEVDSEEPIIGEVTQRVEGRSVYIDVEVTEDNLDEVGYRYNDSRGRIRERRLCSRLEDGLCSGRARISDGEHNVTVYAVDEAGQMVGKEIHFFVDSKGPNAGRIEPSRGLGGGEFRLEFREANPKEVKIHYGPLGDPENESYLVDIANDCQEGRRGKSCEASVDLSDYEGEEIEFYFSVKDIMNNSDSSRESSIVVDSLAPKLLNPEDYWSQGEGRYERYIFFEMNISEEHFDEAVYLDNMSRRPRWRSICRRLDEGVCEGRVSFRPGEHNIEVKVLDEAGNEVEAPGFEFTYTR